MCLAGIAGIPSLPGRLFSFGAAGRYSDSMPLFKKRGAGRRESEAHDAPHPRLPEGVVSEDELSGLLREQIDRALSDGSPLTVLCLAPQLLIGETVAAEEVERAAAAVRGQVRPTDHIGMSQGGALFAVLTNTFDVPALTVSHRVAAELTLRSATIQHRKWVAGVAALPRDGDTAAQLIEAAARSAGARLSSAA